MLDVQNFSQVLKLMPLKWLGTLDLRNPYLVSHIRARHPHHHGSTLLTINQSWGDFALSGAGLDNPLPK